MIAAQWVKDDTGLKIAYDIRNGVLAAEMGLPVNIPDAYDSSAEHLVVFDNGEPITAGRIISRDGKTFIDQLVTKRDKRRMSYGDFALRLLVRRAFDKGADIQYVKCAADTAPFFKRLGFTETGGNTNENGVELTELVRRGDITGGCR